ncbi:MAG: EAL and HDOD domain-containing protein, partial [Methanosarcina sp.]
MGLSNLFKRMLGSKDMPAISDRPFDVKPQPASETPQSHRATQREPQVMIHREEMLDGRSRIAGYRFSLAQRADNAAPDAAGLVNALLDENFVAFAQRRVALVQVSVQEWWAGRYQGLVAPQAFFLVAITSGGPDMTTLVKLLTDIRAAGAKTALPGALLSDCPELAPLIDLVLLDLRAYSLENFERLVRRLARAYPGIAIAADGVQSWAEHRMCQSMGVRYSLGGFAAQPDSQNTDDRLNQSRLVVIEMLNLLRREAEMSELAEVAKRDPAITMQVIAMANSPAAGLASPVASLDQAIMVLGRDAVYRWLSLSLFRAGTGGGRDEALLELALRRGRFLELIAADLQSKKTSDELFLVGVLSLLDSLLGLPMPRVLDKLNLPQHVTDVLLKSEGPYSRYLMLALAVEKGRIEQAERLAHVLEIELDLLEP